MSAATLRGTRVLITGGSSGIGLATATLLAREGARIAIVARGELGLAAARALTRREGAEAITL